MQQYNSFAQLYDLFMDDVDYDAWAEYIASFLVRGSRVLECGCGTGEITVRFKRLGFDMIGSDISVQMLALASEKARKLGLNIPFLHMDMRKLSFPKPVDAVIAPCDGVNYLTSPDDAESFFRSAYASLKDNGLLIFDVSSRYKLETVLGMNTFTDIRDNAAYIWQNCYDDSNKLIEMKLEFFRKVAASAGGAPLYERFSETHIQRAHSEKELRTRLSNAGFAILGVYADFGREAPSPGTQRIQFVAKKIDLNENI